MPKLKDILSPSFKSAIRPQASMVSVSRADDSDFCLETVAKGWLTTEQMRHAAERYRLGKSKSGKPIFWMIDELGILRDGHLGDTWVSQLLKARNPELTKSIPVSHCLFGLHLLTAEDRDFAECTIAPEPAVISIVESERSAVILSELIPESLWMAYSVLPNLTPDLLAPLAGHTVIFYPRTDPSMSNYVFFLEYASQVRSLYPSININVDSTLEDCASTSQKSRCIDLLDFILE